MANSLDSARAGLGCAVAGVAASAERTVSEKALARRVVLMSGSERVRLTLPAGRAPRLYKTEAVSRRGPETRRATRRAAFDSRELGAGGRQILSRPRSGSTSWKADGDGSRERDAAGVC